jgi:hypothetical protein
MHHQLQQSKAAYPIANYNIDPREVICTGFLSLYRFRGLRTPIEATRRSFDNLSGNRFQSSRFKRKDRNRHQNLLSKHGRSAGSVSLNGTRPGCRKGGADHVQVQLQ